MKKVNYVTFVIDKSMSMSRFRYTLPQVFTTMVEQYMQEAKKAGQDSWVRLLYFGSPDQEHVGEFTQIPPTISYNPIDGSTALSDALIKAYEGHQAVEPSMVGFSHTGALFGRRVNPTPCAEDVAHLIVVLTDGEENSSRASKATVKSHFSTLSNLTVAVSAPTERARHTMYTEYGIPLDNIQVWEQTDQGLTESTITTTNALGTYTKSRAAGLRSVSTFYTTTDLSDVTKTDLKQCANVTGLYRAITVPKESRIDEFVEATTGQPYVKGCAFYQLTKPELVQSHKDLMVKEKTGRTLYGGPKVRDILGLPEFQDGKVTPGNHANYDVFVQSTANNRKLVRGTTVMVRK